MQAVEQCRTRLEAGLANSRRPLIDLNFRIDAPHLEFELAQGASARFVAVPLPGGLRVQCPPDVPLADDKVQAWLRKVIGEALRVRAKDYLPRRLGQLAAAHGFSYSGVKINSSRTRWGSCSASGQVNLSYSLLLLPDRLIDYVLLHELAHTVELNHGARFWALLDGVCGGKSGQLREELRLHTTDF